LFSREGGSPDWTLAFAGEQGGQAVGNGIGGFCGTDHADLDCVDADVRDDGLDLRQDHVGRDLMDRLHA
jgi:hypothetical protein